MEEQNHNAYLTEPTGTEGHDAENRWFGDMMILQVLADSEQGNAQEREVLTRWMAASKPSQIP